MLAVIDAIGRTGITAYDAAYLVLAESTDAMLLTADALLAAAAGDRAILVSSPGRIGELRASYATANSSWTHWRGAAAYLGELRVAVTEKAEVARRSVRGLDARKHRKVLHVPRDETGVD